MSASQRPEARLAALEIVCQVLDRGRNLTDIAEPENLDDPRDAAFARRLAYGTLRWYGALDWLAAKLLKRPLRERDADVHRLVLIGIYQLWKEDTPAHAAVHATAECARARGKPWAVGLVNAVLRNFERRRNELLEALRGAPERFSHPEWLLHALQADWPGHWVEIAESNNQSPPMWLRFNSRLTSRERAGSELQQAGFTTTTHPDAPEAIRVDPPAPIHRLPGFDEGRLSVQDPAAQLAARLLAPRPGDRVLDACAAPGGKTCHLLELADDLEVTALDRDSRRIPAIEANLARLGLSARVAVGDAANPKSWWDGKPFDRILLDAPCSATGVIRRHPEIKWLRTETQVLEVTGLQATLLQRLWPLLRAGGILVYSTCSILRRENSEQIHEFLQRHTEAECQRPDPLPGRPEPCGRQILPGDADMDGFFYAVLRKPV